MAFLGDAAAGAISGIAGPLFGLIDNLFTSDEERAEAKRKLLEMDQKGQLAQIAVNLKEAESESLFVAGWRPAVGWVCALALAYTYLLQPFFTFLAWVGGATAGVAIPLDTLPTLDLADLLPVLFGLLGLGGLRTVEKVKGANKNR